MKNHQFSIQNGAKIGPGTLLGAKGPRGRKKVPKMVWIWSGLEPFLAPFWDFQADFWRLFLMSFFKACFSVLGPLLGAKGAQKAPKMEPKWSRKGARGHPLGSVKCMAGTVRETYGEVSGRLREATFSRLDLQTLPGGVLGSIFADFRRFGEPLGAPWGSIFGSK